MIAFPTPTFLCRVTHYTFISFILFTHSSPFLPLVVKEWVNELRNEVNIMSAPRQKRTKQRKERKKRAWRCRVFASPFLICITATKRSEHRSGTNEDPRKRGENEVSWPFVPFFHSLSSVHFFCSSCGWEKWTSHVNELMNGTKWINEWTHEYTTQSMTGRRRNDTDLDR